MNCIFLFCFVFYFSLVFLSLVCTSPRFDTSTPLSWGWVYTDIGVDHVLYVILILTEYSVQVSSYFALLQ